MKLKVGVYRSEASKHFSPPSYFCRVYRCSNKAVNAAGDCQDHASPLRTGKEPYTEGAAPVKHTKGDSWGWSGYTTKKGS